MIGLEEVNAGKDTGEGACATEDALVLWFFFPFAHPHKQHMALVVDDHVGR
jgi:hypothetical protein